MSESTKPLTHIGFICDGNRRWARARGLPTLTGHTRGYDKIEVILDALKDNPETKFASFFMFSTENWNRSQEEVDYLMDLVRAKVAALTKKAAKENLRLCVCGRPEPVAPDLWQKLQDAEQATAKNTGMTVGLCFNYGGLWEIVDAANAACVADETNLTPETFAKYLYHPEIPPCDLIVRTSGEERISGFQLWRAAYSEFIFVKKHFPALTSEDVAKIIQEYHNRHRRFGK